MAIFQRHFTLEEANQLLPWIRETFSRIHALQQEIANAPDADQPVVFLPIGGNGKGKQNRELHRITQEIQDLIDSLMDRGIVIQDLMRGLIDFPSWREGREVFLCYELADGDSIVAWHTLNGGFAGRRPLDEKGSLPGEADSS